MKNQPWSFEQQELALKLYEHKEKTERVLRNLSSNTTNIDYGDLFHNALIRAVNRKDQFRGDAEILSWFTRIAINEFISTVIRKGKVHGHISGKVPDHYIENDEGDLEDYLYFHPDPAPNPEEVMITRNLLAEMKAKLPEDKWRLIEQRYLFGKRNDQIKEETGIKENTSKVDVYRALKRLELFGLLPPKRILGPKKTYKKRKPKTMGAVAGG